jgi:hypothetical protein
MTSNFHQLPLCIYQILRDDFLSSSEYQKFLNCSKFFDLIRKETFIFSLTPIYSHQFLYNQSFRDRIINRIMYPKDQLGLKFVLRMTPGTEFGNEAIPNSNLLYLKCTFQLSDRFLTSLHDIRKLELWNCPCLVFPETHNLSNVTIRNFPNLMNVRNLSYLKKLVIDYCTELEDITPLKDIPYLYFHHCPKLSNISCLGQRQISLAFHDCVNIRKIPDLSRVKVVKFRYCNNLSDDPENLSSLGQVHYLELYSCDGIRNISSFTNNHTLYLDECHEDLVGYSALATNIIQLRLSFCNLEDLSLLTHGGPTGSLCALQQIELANCPLLTDVSPLRSIKKVVLRNCPRIWSVSSLGSVKVLFLLCLNLLEDIAGLGEGNDYVNIQYCFRISDFSPLQAVKKVEIVNS